MAALESWDDDAAEIVPPRERFKWHQSVLADRRLTNRAKVQAGAILHRYNATEACAWPSILTLACDTGQSQAGVKKGISELRGHGYLVVERAHRKAVNVYRLASGDGYSRSPQTPQPRELPEYPREGYPSSSAEGYGSSPKPSKENSQENSPSLATRKTGQPFPSRVAPRDLTDDHLARVRATLASMNTDMEADDAG